MSEAIDRWTMPSLSGESKQFAFLSSNEQEIKVRNLFESAREQGYQEGFSEGIQKARIDTGAALNALQNYKAQLEAPLDHVDETVVKAMAKLAINLAEKIVRAEIKIEPALMKVQLNDALNALTKNGEPKNGEPTNQEPNSQTDITARMHPEDARTISELIEQGSDFGALAITQDVSIERGDCTLTTSMNVVESKVKDRLDQIAQQLMLLIEEASTFIEGISEND